MAGKLLLTTAAAALCASFTHAAFCGGSPNPNAVANTYAVNNGQGTLQRTATNAKAYRAGTPGMDFWVLHLWGNSSYDFGFAQGTIMKQEIQSFVPTLWTYLEQQVAGGLEPTLPAWLADIIGNLGLDAALDVLIDITKPYTGDYLYEELRGIADAADVDYDTLKRIHLMGELTQGDCTMIGAWGKATAGGNLLQLRALDWDTDGPFKDYSAAIVYHVDSEAHPELGHSFINVGFLSWVGSLTGVSSSLVGINEIGVSFPDDSFGAESFTGIPFVFLLRDILQFDNNLTSALNRIQESKRTCDLILGVGSGQPQDGVVRGIQYSASVANVYGDGATQLPVNASWHAQMDDVVYNAMDWLCPSYNLVAGRQLQYGYGALTPEVLIGNVTSITQTGDLHLAVYDLTEGALYVSFMAGTNSTIQTPRYAYDRQPTKLMLADMWAEQRP